MKRVATVGIILILLISIIVSCSQKKTKEQLLAEALKYEKAEDFTNAVATLNKLVEEYPQASELDSVLFQIGQIYSNNLSDYGRAVSAHEKLIQVRPQSPIAAQSLFMIGFHFANNIKNLDSARVYYEKFIEKYPEHELVTSVKWELDHLGQDINEIDLFQNEKTSKN
ncbi:hypothetical protein B6D60_01850 [candidate division KSB1 bacterium 4484_87]|nr:MAG: hypothetical protein B6D60_01850 [candidate division KSB1 bacterium 4484_87]